MNKEHFRFYIKIRTALNIPPSVIYNELHSVHGDQVPCLRTVERWAKWFCEGREEIEDEARSGRPVTETTSENIEQIRLLIDNDPYFTIEELQEQTDLSYGTIHRIITSHLNLLRSNVTEFVNDRIREKYGRLRPCFVVIHVIVLRSYRSVIVYDRIWRKRSKTEIVYGLHLLSP